MAQDDLDFDDIYNEFVDLGYDPATATQYAAYQYIINPSGAIKQVKLPENWYSDEEWYEYEAPDYLKLKEYAGNDNFLNFNKSVLFDEQGNLKPEVASGGANYIFAQVTGPDGTDARSNLNVDPYDHYQQLLAVYNQKVSADNKIENQSNTHPFAQYGLSNPNQRYYFSNAKDSKQRELDATAAGIKERKNYVPLPDELNSIFQNAVDTQVKNFGNKLKKQGFTQQQVFQAMEVYEKRVVAAYNQQLAQSRVTPFTYTAARRVRAAKRK